MGEESQLKKTLSLSDLVFIGVGSILGSGGFNLIGEAVAKGGNLWPLTLAASTAVFLGSSYTYEKAFEIFKTNTAESDVVKSQFGDVASGITATSILMFNIISISTILVFAAHMIYPDASWLGQVSFAILFLLGMAFFSLQGIEINKEIINLLSILLIIVFAGISFIGLGGVATKGWVSVNTPTSPQTIAMSLLFFYFVLAGFDALIKFTEEAKDKKDIPRSFYISNLISAALTLGLSIAVVSWIHIKKSTNLTNIIGDILDIFLGGKSAEITKYASVIYMVLTSFIVFLASTRYLYGLGQQYDFLKFFTDLNEAKVPTTSTYFTTAVAATGILVNHTEKLVKICDFALSSQLFIVSAAATKIGFAAGQVPVIEGLTSASLLGLMAASFI
uniref:Amino acid permease n=1 Tax=viral metagenome TaxID=1070528 RepID=A0A6C0BK79_9ZZZZ